MFRVKPEQAAKKCMWLSCMAKLSLGRPLMPACHQGVAAAGLVPALAGALPRWFAATRHSAFLYVASELVKVFGDQASLAPQLGAPRGR